MSAQTVFIIFAGLVGTAIGFVAGYARGKAVGWLEHYEFAERLKCVRRDRHGRFVAIKANQEGGL